MHFPVFLGRMPGRSRRETVEMGDVRLSCGNPSANVHFPSISTRSLVSVPKVAHFYRFSGLTCCHTPYPSRDVESSIEVEAWVENQSVRDHALRPCATDRTLI